MHTLGNNDPRTASTTPREREREMSTIDNIRAAYDGVLESLTCQAFALRPRPSTLSGRPFSPWTGTVLDCVTRLTLGRAELLRPVPQDPRNPSIYKQLDPKDTGNINVEKFERPLPANARRSNIVNIAWKNRTAASLMQMPSSRRTTRPHTLTYAPAP